ncbi:MAG: CotH kinase family protein [Polyangiaceae bacterium]|nr:CotH kinase family protein [Polyangiaceae bacterium]
MTTAVPGAEIRYTTDGTLPTAESTLYAGTPLSLTATTQVRAQPFISGTPGGLVSTGMYVARTIDPTSNLPIIIVDGYGGGKPSDKSVYLDAAVMIFEPVDGVASMAALPAVALRAGYHVRGQSSASFPQTPYKIELWDNANQDLDCPVLGMPADSDWALIPPYYDRSLVRNPFVFALGRDMGMQSPRDRFAELYINYEAHPIGEGDYQGIYWVTETIKNNKVRTNLAQLKEEDTALPDITGGYIFKFDQMAAEEPTLTCTGSDPISGFGFPGFPGGTGGRGAAAEPGTCWTDLEVVDPEPLIEPQQTWLTQYVQEFHDTLHLTPVGDYTAYIDVPSFIDYLLICEMTMDVDSYVRSAFYFKDRDGKINAGPLWDYNFALGGVGAMNPLPDTSNQTGWRVHGQRNVNNWYPKLVTDPAFVNQVVARYTELRQTLLSQAALEARITEFTTPLQQAIVRDFAKWPVEDIITSSTGFVGGPTVPTWEEQVEVMRSFLVERLAWMDTNLPQIGNPPATTTPTAPTSSPTDFPGGD